MKVNSLLRNSFLVSSSRLNPFSKDQRVSLKISVIQLQFAGSTHPGIG